MEKCDYWLPTSWEFVPHFTYILRKRHTMTFYSVDAIGYVNWWYERSGESYYKFLAHVQRRQYFWDIIASNLFASIVQSDISILSSLIPYWLKLVFQLVFLWLFLHPPHKWASPSFISLSRWMMWFSLKTEQVSTLIIDTVFSNARIFLQHLNSWFVCVWS